jgi:hypothetical protein
LSAQTFTARQTAAVVAKRTGRPCDGKRVRAWAREHLARFNDDGYTTHAYTSRERDAIVDGLVKRSAPRATGTNGRASSASRGRKPSPKPSGATRKASPAPKPTPKSDGSPEAS